MNKIKEAERKIDACVDAVMNGTSSKRIESAKVEDIIDKLIENGDLTRNNERSLLRRKDSRSYFEFFLTIRKHYTKEALEEKMIKSICEKHGHSIFIKEHGNKDKGRSRLINNNSKADKKVMFDNELYIMDLKYLREHCFKIDDLREYAQEGAGMFVLTDRFLYRYLPKTVKNLSRIESSLKYKNKVFSRWGVSVIKIGEDDKSVVSLRFLVEKGYIERMER